MSSEIEILKLPDLTDFAKVPILPEKPLQNQKLLLQGRQLKCVRGYTVLFDNLNFEIGTSCAIRVKGSNGKGKTSLLRIIAGLTQADSGEVHFNNTKIHRNLAHYSAHTSYLGHRLGLSDILNPVENLVFLENLEIAPAQVDISQSLEAFEIGHISQLPCFRLSAGQKQRVALARIFRSPAPIWILDEPATALDDSAIAILSAMMVQHVQRGGILIYTSHQEIHGAEISPQIIDL